MILLHHQCAAAVFFIFYFTIYIHYLLLFVVVAFVAVALLPLFINRHYHHHHSLVLLLYYYIVYNLVDKMSAEFRSTFTFGFPPPHDRVNLGILKHLTADLTSSKVIVEFAYKRERCLLLMR